MIRAKLLAAVIAILIFAALWPSTASHLLHNLAVFFTALHIHIQ